MDVNSTKWTMAIVARKYIVSAYPGTISVCAAAQCIPELYSRRTENGLRTFADSVAQDLSVYPTVSDMKATQSASLYNRVTLTYQRTVLLSDQTARMHMLIWSKADRCIRW